MRIIISPAKKMNSKPELMEYRQFPQFLEKTEELHAYMKQLNYEESKAIWKCNDKIAAQNYERFQTMNLTSNLSAAIFSYEGIQYQYMAPEVMDEESLVYLEKHLRIISGFYGILRPFDGVVPYRLEMLSKFETFRTNNLYEYWKDAIAMQLFEESTCVINLASKEYSKCITKYASPKIPIITCIFGEDKQGKVVERSTLVKMARGEMVRFLAEKKITTVEEIKTFHRLGFRYKEELSDAKTFVFVKGEEEC